MSRSNVGVVLDVEPRRQPLVAEPANGAPFRILILADLSGASADRTHLERQRPVSVDRDSFDEVLARFAPVMTLPFAPGESMTIRELDDFHPDRLWARLPVFALLRELREKLDDPRTFAAAARALLGDESASASPSAAPSTSPPVAPLPPSGSLLDAMVEQVEGPAPAGAAPPARARPRDELQEYIRGIVAPHVEPGEDPRKAALLARIDDAAGDIMRALLHDAAWQRIEAVWRSLDLLVRRTDTGPDLTIHVVDAPRAALDADLAPERALERSALYRLLVEETVGTAGGRPWALIVGDYHFGPAADDVALLGRMAELAQRAGAPLLAAADPALAGAPGFSVMTDPEDWQRVAHKEWNALRRSDAASFVGLALPRMLLRLPYGQGSDECESLEFEELSSPPEHAGYLWGNAAFALALLLAESFVDAGWAMRPGMHQDIGGLPLHVYRENGEAVVKPCAESWMTERAAARLLEHGLMPLASMKDRDAVHLVRFQSIAYPPTVFAGRWRSGGQ